MATEQSTQRLTLTPEDTHRLANLGGHLNEHIHQIEKSLALQIRQRGGEFELSGEADAVREGIRVLESLYAVTADGTNVSPDLIHLTLKESGFTPAPPATPQAVQSAEDSTRPVLIKTPHSSIKPRGRHQRQYVESIRQMDINFGIGPAGTGKTYLAVACAVEALMQDQVKRLLLVRPAVEAGEKLGFLPGDLAQKIDPYLRPLYDALYEMLGFERVTRLIEKNVIEVAPLAYMRGRTLNGSFIILDESQNTTISQMKMFLTRIGFGSTAVITGDVTQIDLPSGTRSGLVHVLKVLNGLPGIGFNFFDSKDVVRHALVQRIVEAYDAYERQTTIKSLSKDDGSHERDG
ncbi:MAG TPA: PhoH family protein [Pseudohongiella sp.]|nr:PhoH family protein [Gammaproteobacteria bacterium]MBJ53634.1 PhoH family protein [Gammaproteobacteria bacterium]HBX37237.1 PhoH family protein [Pseudohongiella sp.]|tara:strand:+ start:565 stop:1608 length:1044 start_codon:yes stop_codon:yes gene_type:complete